MNENAENVLCRLAECGLMTARQISDSLGMSIESTYEALVHLESAGFAFIATTRKRFCHATESRDRLWGSWEGMLHPAAAAAHMKG